MGDKEIITHVKRQIEDWVIGDIHRAIKGGSKVGAFILASCAIDYLASFWSGADSNAKTYKAFVAHFFDERYEPEDLYKSLRCGLVHNYTIRRSAYLLVDAKSGLHFQKADRTTILNLEDFVEDFRRAKDAYFERLDMDPTLKQNLVGRYKEVAILGLIQLDSGE